MSQIGPGQNPYGPAPMGPQQGGYPQPVVYRPGVPNVPMAGYGPPDAYRPGMPNRGPMMAGAPGQPAAKPKEYIAQKDVAFGIAGAVGGYFLAGMIGVSGPIGALILGIALLAISAGMRAFKKDDAPQQPGNTNQMPRPPVYPQAGQQPQMYQNRYNYQNEQMPGQPPRYPQ